MLLIGICCEITSNVFNQSKDLTLNGIFMFKSQLLLHFRMGLSYSPADRRKHGWIKKKSRELSAFVSQEGTFLI